MIWWEQEFKARLQNHGVPLELQKRYVDDNNRAMQALSPGSQYRDGMLIHGDDDNEDGLEADARTMAIIQLIGNDIHPSTQLEVDYPSKNEDSKMPILDLKCWVEKSDTGARIMHEH